MSRKPPHPGDLRKRITQLASEGSISFGYHAFAERSPERAIDINDALNVLKHGMIKGAIEPGINPGEWKCKMVDKADKSSRWIGVVTAVINNRELFIVTVEWEDT